MKCDVAKAIEEQVHSYMSQYQDCSHDWLHVDRVRKLALKLAAEEDPSMDMEMVELAAMLHDIGDFKYVKEGETGKQIIPNLLESNGCPQDRIEGVLEIVANVSFRHELEHGCYPDRIKHWAEFSVVQDADRLDAIGAVGVARTFAYSGRRNTPFYNPGEKHIENLTAEAYNEQTKKNAGSCRFHFDEKLLKLKEMMKSKAGKKEAEARQEFMQNFLKQFDLECGLQA